MSVLWKSRLSKSVEAVSLHPSSVLAGLASFILPATAASATIVAGVALCGVAVMSWTWCPVLQFCRLECLDHAA